MKTQSKWTAATTWAQAAAFIALAVLPAVPLVRGWLDCPAEWWWPGAGRPGLYQHIPIYAAEWLAALLLTDLWLTAYHVWWHGSLARLHAFGVHHAVPEHELDWTVGQLFGIWEPLISIPTIWAIILLFGVPLGPMTAVSVTMTLFAMWAHTSPKPWHRRIEWLCITPASHRVHHSADPALYGLNCAFIFSFWDRALGTRAGGSHAE